MALQHDEVVQLGLRFTKASVAANEGGYETEFDVLTQLAGQAEAVICMPITRLLDLLSDTSLLSTFGLQLEGGARVPQDNRFDSIRASVEEAFFPNFSKEIRFAALSIRDVGQVSYGPCSVTLKRSAIENRASVFEYPLFIFAEKTGLKLSDPVPPGHRAPWDNRAKLAAVKVGKTCASAAEEDMPDLILPPPTDTLSDCIEVHIYGSINKHSIAKVTIVTPDNETDKLLQKVALEKLSQLNISARAA